MNLRVLTRRTRATGRHMRPVLEWAIVCPLCELDLPGYGDENEAAHLAGIHNDLHHGLGTFAFVAAVTEPVGRPQRGGDAA